MADKCRSLSWQGNSDIMKCLKPLVLTIALATFIGGTVRAETISSMMVAGLRADKDDLNIPSFLSQEKDRGHKKSKFLALGLSLLLPGAGQYYTENKSKMVIFGSAEGLVWSGFFGLRMYGGWKKDDYRAWAAFHAGADVNGKPDIYYEKLTYYDNLNEYNQLARVVDGPEARLFPVSPQYYWNWDSDQSRSHYRDLRNQSKNAYRRSLLFVGAALVNRILAGIDAYREAGAYSREKEFSRAGWNLYYSSAGIGGDGKIEVGLAMRF